MFPESLQGKLILLFVSLVIITNGLFAIVGYSRERIKSNEESSQTAVFIGRILVMPALRMLVDGDKSFAEEIYAKRSGIAKDFQVTFYDENWWRKWGDHARIPPEGFPRIDLIEEFTVRSGVGNFSKEYFFVVKNDEAIIGAVGIGQPGIMPDYSNSGTDFLLMVLLTSILGIAVAVLASRSLLEPLSQLMEGIEVFGGGDFATRVEIQASGEIKKLADSFNHMAYTVQETFKENLQRNRILDEKLQELWEIYELMRNMSLTIEFRMILEKFLEKAQTLSFSSYGQIILQNKQTRLLEAVVISSPILPGSRNRCESNINRCFIEMAVTEDSFEGISIICIPLLSGKKANGVLFLAKHDQAKYSDSTRRFLETIAPVASSLIENASLYEELADWNQHMKNILASINAGLVTFDRKGRFIIANDYFFNLLGISKSGAEEPERLSDCLKRLKDDRFAESLLLDVHNFTSSCSSSDSQSRQWHKNGQFVDMFTAAGEHKKIQISLYPLVSENEIRGTIMILVDVTEQKRLEQQFIETEKWVLLGRLAASVAHEIRNPLVAIRSLVEIIRDEVDGSLKEHAEVVLGEVLRLNRVVAELLSLIKPEVANLKKCNLRDLLTELFLLIRHEATRNGIKLISNFKNDNCLAMIDAEKIKQALLNIVLNAIQAVGSGGQIDVELARNGNQVAISIKNDGQPIPENIAERLFEPFFTTKANGTGLGLAISRKIVELHGGTLAFTSNEKYTEFCITLPLGEINGKAGIP